MQLLFAVFSLSSPTPYFTFASLQFNKMLPFALITGCCFFANIKRGRKGFLDNFAVGIFMYLNTIFSLLFLQ